MEPLGGHANFGAQREERREHRGQNFGGHHEHQAVGHDDETVADDDVGFAVGVIGADELIAEADFAAEVGGPGFFGEKGIGAGFDEAAIDVIGDEDAAEARGGFEQNVFDADAPHWRFSSSENAAERPEIPPPMMAIRGIRSCELRALSYERKLSGFGPDLTATRCINSPLVSAVSVIAILHKRT